MSITTEAEALARLDELRTRRAQARLAEADALAEIKNVLREAAGLIDQDGQPLNRSILIERSGLSRRTAYQILNVTEQEQ